LTKDVDMAKSAKERQSEPTSRAMLFFPQRSRRIDYLVAASLPADPRELCVSALDDDGPVPAFPIRSARRAVAVPPGRMRHDISEDRILLHTIQTAEAFGALPTNGVLKPDPVLAEPPLHADGYDWMYRQMDARLPTSGDGAIWLWARIRRQDLVELCRLAPGQALLTCRVPRQRVLLSHFGDWHAVLNRHPLIIEHSDESDEANGAQLDLIFDDVDGRVRAAGVSVDAGYQHSPAKVRTDLEDSWGFMLDPTNYGRYEPWQATVHALRSDDVVQAVRIEG
jgi:hypothetical protein